MKKATSTFPIVLLALLILGILSSCNKQQIFPSLATTNLPGDTTSVPDSSFMGLFAWYPFNNTGGEFSGSGVSSASVYNISSTADRNGHTDEAYLFDGTDSYLKIADNPNLNLNGTDFTINIWIKLDNYGGPYGSAIIDKRGVGPANGWMLSVSNSATKNVASAGLVTFIPGSTDAFAVDTTVLSINTWYMITVMYNSAQKQCSMYINGVLNSVTNINPPAASTIADIYIGRDNIADTSQSYFFKGSMDDLRIYTRTLSVSELKKLMLRTD